MNINDLIKLIQAGNVTVNVSVTATSPIVEETVEEVDTDSGFASSLPETDFDLDDRVLVCHIRKDGERVHTIGTVIEVAGKDDVGYYTRVLGDNGKHYRAGLKYNEERLGTVIYELD
jgi:hypothetical protein